MDYKDYIKTELLILIPVLYIIGIGLKKSKVPDKRIPVIIGIIGIVLSAVWVIDTSDIFGIKDAAHAVFISVTQRQGGTVLLSPVQTNFHLISSMDGRLLLTAFSNFILNTMKKK